MTKKKIVKKAKEVKPKVEPKIEFQEQIAEANSGSYQSIRFSKVKYKNNPELFIDIRTYQRGYDDNGENIYFPTRIGFQFTEREFKKIVSKYTLLPTTYVHPEIIKKSFDLLNTGHFDSAVLQAFKILETKLRKKIGATSEEIGVTLIRKAFHPATGLLTDYDLPKSEREAFSNYMAGAYGYYKNPCSHRDVEMDFIQAFERIVVASDLLKTIDKAKKK
jgi:uncharacterized protein (TIGR02391 family)